MKISKKHVIIAAFVTTLLVAGIIYFISNNEIISAPPPNVVVKTATAKLQPMPLEVKLFANLLPVNKIEVTSEIAGTITDILFTDDGAKVEAGTVLIKLEDTVQRAALAQAEAQEKLAALYFKRATELHTKKVLADQEYDQIAADLAIAKAATTLANANLEKTYLVAPFNGRLGARKISKGQYVAAGQPLLDIVDTEELRLNYAVPEKHVQRIAVNQLVSITSPASPNETFTGHVYFISPDVNTKTRTIEVEAHIKNDDERLRPGLSVQAIQVLATNPEAVVIPEEAIIATIEGYEVFLVEGGIAQLVSVEIGSRRDGWVEIITGIMANEIIVIEGQQKLRAGMLVSTPSLKVAETI